MVIEVKPLQLANPFLKVKSFIILHFKLYFIYMRQSLNYYIILEISFPYFRNDFKFCLFGQRFFFSIFIDLFCQFIIKLAKEPEKSTSIFLQPSSKMTRSPALKVSSLLQLARTSNKTKATRACTPNRQWGNESFDTHRVILFQSSTFSIFSFKSTTIFRNMQENRGKVLEKVAGKGRMFISARKI